MIWKKSLLDDMSVPFLNLQLSKVSASKREVAMYPLRFYPYSATDKKNCSSVQVRN